MIGRRGGGGVGARCCYALLSRLLPSPGPTNGAWSDARYGTVRYVMLGLPVLSFVLLPLEPADSPVTLREQMGDRQGST